MNLQLDGTFFNNNNLQYTNANMHYSKMIDYVVRNLDTEICEVLFTDTDLNTKIIDGITYYTMSAYGFRQINNSLLMCITRGTITISTHPGEEKQRMRFIDSKLRREDSIYYLVLDPFKIFNFYINDVKCNFLRDLTQILYANSDVTNIKIELYDDKNNPTMYDLTIDEAQMLLEYILNVHLSVVYDMFRNIKCPPLVPVTKRYNIIIEQTEPYQYVNMIHISDYNKTRYSDIQLPLSDKIIKIIGIPLQNLVNSSQMHSELFNTQKNDINHIHKMNFGTEKKCNKVIKFDEKGNIVPAHIAYNNIVSGDMKHCYSKEKDCYGDNSRNFIYNLLFEAFSILIKKVNNVPIMTITKKLSPDRNIELIVIKNLKYSLKNISEYIENINDDNTKNYQKIFGMDEILNKIKIITETDNNDNIKINAIKDITRQFEILHMKYLKYKSKYNLLKYNKNYK